MTNKLIGFLGLLATFVFATGFIGLFIINHQAYVELNNLSITSFNLSGMDGEIWIKLSYIFAGLLTVVLAIGLFKTSENKSILVVGKIFLFITGIIWTTFGLIYWEINSELSNHVLLLRTITAITTGMLGLLFTGGEIEKIARDKFLKYYTLASGLVMLLLSFLSLFVYVFDESWIRANLSLTIYFLWFGVFGIRILLKKSEPNNAPLKNKQTPLKIEGISESLYAGFWTRLGSLLLDFIFILPVVFLVLYLNGLGKNIYFYTVIPNLIFSLWYHIYLPKKYGGTPGKLAVGITIIRLDGQPIDWKEAVLRHVVLFSLTILSSIIMTTSLLTADEETFTSLTWLQQSQYLMSLSPIFFKFYTWTSNIWIYSEFVVLLTNKRKRAIHDFIAGTVIVRAKYLNKIRESMTSEKRITDDTPNDD